MEAATCMYVQGKGGRISAELLPGAARGPGRNGPPPPRRGHDAFSTLLDPQCLDLAPLPAAGAGRGRARRFYRWFLCAVSLLSLVAATKWLWSSSSRGGQRAGDAAGVYLRGPGPAAAAAAAGAGEPKRRVAVCFFGLTRSLRWTLPSLQRRLLGALEEAGMEVDVFVHTFSLEEVNNKRAGERGVDYGSFVDDFQALQPTRSLVTNQDDFDLVWPDPLSLTHYNWIYRKREADDVIRNVFRAYWSMSMAWGLMAEHSTQGGFEYDAVVLARPDVWFHNDVDLPSRTFPLPERKVFLPSFDAGGRGQTRKNDRFAYGSVTAMRVAMNRIGTLMDADAGKYRGDIDSEWLLGHHLLHNEISVKTLDLLVTRVRLTRDIPRFDQRLVVEACESGDDPIACDIIAAGFKFPAEEGAS